MPLTPEQRRLRASAGGYAKAARYPTDDVTVPARRGFRARFEREVAALAAERGEALTDAERERRVEAAFRSHMTRLALASARARSTRG